VFFGHELDHAVRITTSTDASSSGSDSCSCTFSVSADKTLVF
jgi:hypothetical protein